MGTFRDDIVRAGRKLIETVEERTERKVVPAEQLQLLESDRSRLRIAEKTLQRIGWDLLNWQPGDPVGPGGFELRADMRLFYARQALTAWVEDPLAGQQVDLYVSFVLGRGVPHPNAHDPEVQDHLDATWKDEANRRTLTSLEAMTEKLIDLCIQSNVYFTFFDDGRDGMARASMLSFDEVVDAIRHSELAAQGLGDRYRILYYKVLERRVKYDFDDDTRKAPVGENDPGSTAKVVFYERFGAFDDTNPVMAAQDEGLRSAPKERVRRGKVYHLTVNKTSDMAFGVPRMQRLLRWYTAYNETLESHVKRMKAMASIYMKATATGGQRDLDRIGQMALNRVSAFGAAQDVDDGPGGMPLAPTGPGIIGQNESLNYEPFKIDSGAGDVQASAPIIRGQAGGPWPDNYISGHAEGNLAGATSMELPTLKFIEREQELVAGVLRGLGRASIDAAVREGVISEWRDPSNSELEQMQAAEEAGEPAPFETNDNGQVRRDLDFDINLPSPLKRAMTDLVTAAVSVASAVDPNGEYPEMSRWLFGFCLSEAFDVEDSQRIVDQVMPRKPEPVALEGEIDPATGQPIQPGATGADGQKHTEDNAYGAPRKSAPAEQQAKVQETPADDDAAADPFAAFEADALAHLAALDGLAPASNGNGAH